MNRQRAEARGLKAENLAPWWLRLHGWRILDRRVRLAGGEVDLVARRGQTVAFVEVTQRASEDAGKWSLDDYRLRRLAAADEPLARPYAKDGDDTLIDAIFILPHRLPRHLANVWHG